VALPAAEALRPRNTASRRHMPRLALIPERLAVLIMEEWQEASLLAGSRASAEASMGEVSEAEVFTEAEAVAGDSVQLPETKLMIWRKKSCAQTI